jgi:UDP-N-acetylmuramoyl-tripeptide--D-alanyl-D-alanine ligase
VLKKLTIGETVKAVSGKLLAGRETDTYTGVSTDSRTVSGGDLFFAIEGERFDAHDFLSQATGNGCCALAVSKTTAVPQDFSGAVIEVSDTLRAYQDLAAYYRNLIDPTTVGVTGSVGKTSVKDMLAFVCGAARRTVRSEKNYNNHIGVPRTIFEMEEDTETLILEMGMNHSGEIRRLAEIGRPDIAIISNIGVIHREHFDTDDGIFNAKMEITAFFGKDNVLVVNGDDPYLKRVREMPNRPYRLVTVGADESCDFIVETPQYTGDSEISFRITHGRESQRFILPVAGLYNGVNAGLAVAALHELGIGMGEASEALRTIERTAHRLQLLECDGFKIIDDTYNAGPDSMRSGVEYLMAVTGDRKIAVLAGMNELGDRSSSLHEDLGRFVATSGVDLLVTVGEKARGIAAGAGMDKHRHFADNDAAAAFLIKQKQNGDVYLMKGSRSMRMEDVVDALMGENRYD